MGVPLAKMHKGQFPGTIHILKRILYQQEHIKTLPDDNFYVTCTLSQFKIIFKERKKIT